MAWDKFKSISTALKPTLKFFNVMMPLLATALFWTYLDRVVQILAVLVLSTLWLKYLGFDVDIATRLDKTRFGKIFHFIIRSANPAAKMNEEYFEEAGKILADQTILVAQQVKKIEEEINMSKLNKWREQSLLFLTHNKKMITLVLVIILFGLDLIFEFSATYGLPPDVWYYVAAIIMFFVLWAAGGEGWTGNTLNQARKDAILIKQHTQAEVKKFEKSLAKITKEIDEIIAQKVDGVVPPHLKTKYSELIESKNLYTRKINDLLLRINPKELE